MSSMVLETSGETRPISGLSAKKGVALRNGTVNELIQLKASWYFNYGPIQTKGVLGVIGTRFVPMLPNPEMNIWGSGPKSKSFEIKKHMRSADILLTFHEPDKILTSEKAISSWDKVISTRPNRIGSPITVSNPLTDPWLKTFMASHARVDFICVQWKGPAVVEDLFAFVDAIFEEFKKPIWLTEFHVADTNASAQDVMSFLVAALEGLESRTHVEKYAWLSEPATASALFTSEGTLTDLGHIYANQPAHLYSIKKGISNGPLHIRLFHPQCNPWADHSWTETPYVPMVWSKDKEAPEKADIILGFNEPDLKNQANMSVDECLEHWHKVTDTGASFVVSPVFTQWGQKAFKRFMDGNEKYGKPRCDAIGVHWYSGPEPSVFLNYIDEIYNTYKLPLWVTEFCVADWGAEKEHRDNNISPERVYAFMEMVIPELEKRDYVQRYAWYSDPKDLPQKTGALQRPFDDENPHSPESGGMTALGKLYASY